jgi:lipopolysaccharide export LptBFGC system permease protein LptF
LSGVDGRFLLILMLLVCIVGYYTLDWLTTRSAYKENARRNDDGGQA